MVRLFHNWVSSPWDGYPIKSAGCPHSLHRLWLGGSVCPSLGDSELDQSNHAGFECERNKYIYYLNLHISFLFIILPHCLYPGRQIIILLSHTNRWGTWASSVLGSIYNYWFKFRPSSFDDFLSDLFLLFSNITPQRGLSWLFHPESTVITISLIFYFHSPHHYPLVFFLTSLLIYFQYLLQGRGLCFLFSATSQHCHSSWHPVDIEKYLMDEYISPHYTISLY